jgi:hypothetical protein
MTEPTVCVVGSSEAALSASTREWLDRQPTAGTENDVIMRASLGMDRADVPLKRAAAERLRAVREKAQDLLDMHRLRATEPPSNADVLARIRYVAEQQEADERTQAKQEAEQRAARAEARLAELQAELAEERRTQARSSRRASDAVDGWAADRRRRRRQESTDEYARAYGSSSYYIR